MRWSGPAAHMIQNGVHDRVDGREVLILRSRDVLVVDAHGAAHDDDKIKSGQAGQDRRFVKTGRSDMGLTGGQLPGHAADSLKRDMLQDVHMHW